LRWRDTAGVKIKLKVPTVQRHHRECAARARCLAISNVRFLYGLPLYNVSVKFKWFNIYMPSCMVGENSF